MSDYSKLRDLPVNVESLELEANDYEYSAEFTRGSTIVHLQGDGHEGMGEDVAYEVLDHIANRDLGPRFDLTGPNTLGELCSLLGELDLYEGAPPERDVSRDYRRWAYESAALDLALRQNGVSLHEAVGRDPKPVRFVCSTRLTSFGDDTVSSTHAITSRLERYPDLEFKLDPENDWTPELIEEIADVATVRVMDLKGYYKLLIIHSKKIACTGIRSLKPPVNLLEMMFTHVIKHGVTSISISNTVMRPAVSVVYFSTI